MVILEHQAVTPLSFGQALSVTDDRPKRLERFYGKDLA
jgi:hypothetical protein